MTDLRALLALAFFLPAQGVFAAESDYRSELLTRARELGLSREQRWLRLLHYRPSGKGRRSEADGEKFFLAPEGRTDPQAELDAAISAFFAPEPSDPKSQHPQCRFPARYHWLKERLSFDPSRLPERACPDFEAWRAAIGADGVSVVFASAFLNNPASMFGHTFLRFHRKGAGTEDALLDYTINFAASPDTSNPFLYTLKGLNGSFKGEYSLLPFYMKTQEYGNLEMRDLWDYPLALDQSRIDALIRHAWEMGSTHFNYYFFTKNCSYQLLTLLEAADDSLDASAGFRGPVIPADTVRALIQQPGLAKEAQYRPSFASEIKARRARLFARELSAATELGREVTPEKLKLLEDFPKERQALILESAQDYLRYKAGFYSNQSSSTLSSEHALLIARGRLGLPPAPVPMQEPLPLTEGHDTARIGLGGGISRTSSFSELSWRDALHDLASPDIGYTPDSQLEMGAARLRFDHDDRQLYVERLDLVNIVSMSPLDAWVKAPSWKLSTGVDQAKELGCSGASCMYYNVNVGAGVSAQSRLWKRELYFALPEADLGFGPVLSQDWRAGAGMSAGMIVDLSPRWRVMGEGTYIDYAQRSAPRQRLRLTSSLRLTRDAEIRLTLDRRTPDQEAGLMFYLYY
ncbi:MAG: DUF4105 domain-containing protein [Elusimicrobiota bacterium]|jgi:hypothetical protein